jgi:hypothetical protein
VVVDAWLTNFDHLCDIRIAERRVAAVGEEGVSGFKDSICGITLHGGILPTGRYRCKWRLGSALFLTWDWLE